MTVAKLRNKPQERPPALLAPNHRRRAGSPPWSGWSRLLWVSTVVLLGMMLDDATTVAIAGMIFIALLIA